MKSFAALPLVLQLFAATAAGNPFAFFQPSLTLKSEERRQLDRGQPIARIMPADDTELAVVAAVPIEIDGDRLVAWVRRIELLKQSERVMAIGRFSDPPRIDDLADMSLDDGDLETVRSCRPDHCGVKLSPGEMSTLQRVADHAGDDWKPMLQVAFREMVLQRVNAYLSGRAAIPPAGESFVYWSKERFSGKPIISATYVTIARSADDHMPDALVKGTQIFATHYLDASLGVTAIVRGTTSSHNYLVYLNRSDVDLLDGTFGGLVRSLMERRLKGEALDVLRGLRRRLESGEPEPASLPHAEVKACRTGTSPSSRLSC